MHREPVKPSRDDVKSLIDLALTEDCPVEDVTTLAVVPVDSIADFAIIAKTPLVVCGADFAGSFLAHLSPDFRIDHIAEEGTNLDRGGFFLKGNGPTRALLIGERSLLNVLQRLCGIATQTRLYVDALQGTDVRVLDTRKTTPGLRLFEKYAVQVGGGENHRFGLSDMVLLKENHLAIEARNGDDYINRAVKLCRQRSPELQVEVEVQTVAEAEMAAQAGADRILLDNMTPECIADCIQVIAKRSEIEVSGGISLETIRGYALPGVDFISVGALTHSVPAADLSLLIEATSV